MPPSGAPTLSRVSRAALQFAPDCNQPPHSLRKFYADSRPLKSGPAILYSLAPFARVSLTILFACCITIIPVPIIIVLFDSDSQDYLTWWLSRFPPLLELINGSDHCFYMKALFMFISPIVALFSNIMGAVISWLNGGCCLF